MTVFINVYIKRFYFCEAALMKNVTLWVDLEATNYIKIDD